MSQQAPILPLAMPAQPLRAVGPILNYAPRIGRGRWVRAVMALWVMTGFCLLVGGIGITIILTNELWRDWQWRDQAFSDIAGPILLMATLTLSLLLGLLLGRHALRAFWKSPGAMQAASRSTWRIAKGWSLWYPLLAGLACFSDQDMMYVWTWAILPSLFLHSLILWADTLVIRATGYDLRG